MIAVGIDPSINSTGVCVYFYNGKKAEVKEYHCIGYKPSKATLAFYGSNGISFHDYGKNPDRPEEYSKREIVKTSNIIANAYELQKILESASEHYGGIDCIVMEGVSYGSVSGSSIVDLAGLNFIYRSTILEEFLHTTLTIASPMEIKKFAVGNGGVDKDIMIKVWSKCEHIDIPEDCKAKVDDIADAYFMALYGMCLCSEDFEKSLELPKVEIPKRVRKKKTQDVPEYVLENFNSIDLT